MPFAPLVHPGILSGLALIEWMIRPDPAAVRASRNPSMTKFLGPRAMHLQPIVPVAAADTNAGIDPRSLQGAAGRLKRYGRFAPRLRIRHIVLEIALGVVPSASAIILIDFPARQRRTISSRQS